MMKLSVFLFLLLTSCSFCSIKSQAQHKPLLGLQSTLSLHQITLRLKAAPTAGWQLGRHQLITGPLLLLKDFNGAAENLPRLNGLTFSYLYLLNKKEERNWRWFLEYQCNVLVLKQSWSSNYWNEAQQQYLDAEQSTRELFWTNFLGIGMQTCLGPKLFLQSSLGAGYYISDIEKGGGSPSLMDNTFDYRPYKNRGPGYAIRLGLYYHFR